MYIIRLNLSFFLSYKTALLQAMFMLQLFFSLTKIMSGLCLEVRAGFITILFSEMRNLKKDLFYPMLKVKTHFLTFHSCRAFHHVVTIISKLAIILKRNPPTTSCSKKYIIIPWAFTLNQALGLLLLYYLFLVLCLIYTYIIIIWQ